MEVKEIYNMLNNGWIYVIQNEDNFLKNIFFHWLDPKDIRKFNNKIFVKKSEKLYNILKNLGMNISLYDSLIAITISFNVDERTVKFDLYSLKNFKDPEVKLREISQKIKENNFENKLDTIF